MLTVIGGFDDPEAGSAWRQTHSGDCYEYAAQNGTPIKRATQKYQIPYKKNFKTHGAVRQITQFPLKLAWAITGHKVQGITIKKPSKVVVHGHPRMPPSMYYVMFSRAQDLEQVYVRDFTKTIKANEMSLKENKNLVNRSINSSFSNNHFCIFMVNIQSLKTKIVDLMNDNFASRSDHICLVETWLNKDKKNNLNIPNR